MGCQDKSGPGKIHEVILVISGRGCDQRCRDLLYKSKTLRQVLIPETEIPRQDKP